MMLARVAETLFSVARDLERAETTARLLEVTHAMELETGQTGSGDWETLLRILGDRDAFAADHRTIDGAAVGWHFTLSDENPGSIQAIVARARNRARTVRDRLSTEIWEALNGFYLQFADWDGSRMQREGVYSLSKVVRQRSYLLQGLIETTMRHDDHWTFLRLGRALERATLSSRLVGVRAGDLSQPAGANGEASVEQHRWESLLRAGFADEAYARTHPEISPRAVVRFLVLDERLPRSVAYALSMVEECQNSLIADLSMAPEAPPLQITRKARAYLHEGASAELMIDPAGYLHRIGDYCAEIETSIRTTCFAAAYRRPGGDWDAQAQGQSQN